MFKKFSFVGVSSAAIALAVLCPSPARALSYGWSFSMGSGNVLSGTIDNLSEGSNTPASPSPGPASVTVTSCTGGLCDSPFFIFPGYVGQTFAFMGSSEINVSGVPTNAGTSGVAAFRYTGTSSYWDLNFLNGTAAYSPQARNNAGSFDMEILQRDLSGNAQGGNTSTGAESFTAVPAPLPLLGLGAATAFSRKLKQRIALKRKQEEVGAAV